MYSSTKSSAAYHPSPPPAPASTNYAFLAKPPKFKHKPQPITVRCAPPRSLPRPTSSRRRASISGSPAIQTSFITLVETPTPTSDTPKTPHLTTHGYTAAFSTLYHRRGSLPDTPRSARRAPTSPKRGATPRSAPSSPKRATGSGSPKRRTHRVPSPTSPFAPPSPTRPQTRPRAKSTTTRIPAPASTLAPPPRTPKLSKIRSFTNLRSRSPSPAPPSRATSPMAATTSTPKQTPKRSKRSATPAHGSTAYTKYRPMPFIQQMQMIQFLEGGTIESHIRRHHVHAGQGTAHTGFAVGQDDEIAHGYAFTDERGMIWFDEEEEWEFACLLPQARRQPRRGIKRLLGKRRVEESEEEWEEFVEEGVEQEDDVVDPDVLLAREDDDLHAGQEELAAFGGTLEGAWGRDRPERSVLKLPEPKRERKTRRQRRRASKVTPPTPAPPPPPPTTVLKQEFLASAFAPSPARSSPSPSLRPAPAAPRATSPFRRFAGKAHHRHARSLSNVAVNAPANLGEGQSFASLGASLRGGSVLDADVPPSPSPSVQWAYTTAIAPLCDPVSRQPSPAPVDPRLRSVSPPPAAARRLGIDPTATVSLQPAPIKKPSFMGLRSFKSTR